MKYIVFCLGFCLLMISCSSTPPEENKDDLESAVSIAKEVAQVEETVPEEQEVQNLEESFPLADFLDIDEEDEEKLEDAPPAETEYLQEIEIIELAQGQIPFEDNLEDRAMITESDVALVVETPYDELVEPALETEPFSSLDVDADKALVVEEVLDTSILEPEAMPENMLEPEPQIIEPVVVEDSLLVETEDAVVPEVVLSEQAGEQSESQMSELVSGELTPLDVDAVEGVVTPIEPSRTVTMDNQQFLDLRYPGKGWVYLGEVSAEGASIGTPSLTYFGRRRTSDDTSFTLRSIKPGTTILHFYKQDVLSATFIDDFIQVTIIDKVAQVGSRVIAPHYDAIVPGYQDVIPQPTDFANVIPPVEDTSGATFQPAASSPMGAGSPDSVSETQISEIIDAENQMRSSLSFTDNTDPNPPVSPDTQIASAASPVSPQTKPSEGDSQTASADGNMVRPASTDMPASDSNEDGVLQIQDEVVQNEEETPQIIPPQDDNVASNTTSLPVQEAADQEVYQLDSTEITVPGNYNPQTGMTMDDLQLPWVQEELEHQRTADIITETDRVESQEDQDTLLAKAQEYFYAEEYPAALECLNQFFAIAVTDFDAAYYLKGQVLESKSDVRNIKEAQKSYKYVVDSYPQSPFWKRAKNRHTYLSRFYFDIR